MAKIFKVKAKPKVVQNSSHTSVILLEICDGIKVKETSGGSTNRKILQKIHS